MTHNPRDATDHSTIAWGLQPSLRANVALAGHYAALQGQHHPAHHHPGHELILWRTGHIECLIEGAQGPTRLRTSPGLVTLLPGQTVHADHALTAYSHMYLIFDADLGVPGLERPVALVDDEAGSLERLLLTIEAEFNGDRPHRAAMLPLLRGQLALLLARLKPLQDSPDERLVQQVERLIEARYAENPRVQDLARELGASSAHVRALFARLRPYSPKAYLTQVRLRHALAYIRHSSLNLDDIATRTGFTSSGHLWRDVRRLTGQSPGSFRR